MVVVFDTDSYAAWGLRRAAELPAHWQVRLVALTGYVETSERQLANAVSTTRFSPADIERLDAATLTAQLRLDPPEVLVLAVRGHVVPYLTDGLRHLTQRPVIVTGFPGIALPPQAYDFHHRRPADLWLVHSKREITEITRAAGARPPRLGLARLPMLTEVPADAAPATGMLERDQVVFATQALVPPHRDDRLLILRRLAEAAVAHPHLTYVVKTRAVGGEAETHRGGVSYESLLPELATRPPNLVVSAEPMADHLRRARGLVTVSSTAALEAAACGVPSIVLTDFGVSDELINTSFEGSGLFGTLADVVADQFHLPEPSWLGDNYFHAPAEDTWLAGIETLVAERAEQPLPPAPRVRSGLNGIYYRHDATSPWRGTPLEPLERLLLSSARRLHRWRARN